MRFNVLGSLEVLDDGDAISLGGPKKRAALGYLLLHANEVVATSRLINALWPEGSPPTARKMVQNMVSDLRNVLGPSRLRTHSPGYLFRAEPEDVDLLDFQRLARSGRETLARGGWTEAADLLGRACRLWRGPALADLADTGVDWPKLGTLREAQLTTLEDYFEAELAAGHHYDHLAELDRLVAAEPHRERACRQLMLALYRCGRQVDALDTYQRTSAVLMAKFGLEPTRDLRDMEQAILRHDPTLTPPTEPSRPPASDSLASERKLISVLTIAFELGTTIDREHTDDLLAELAGAVRAELTEAGAVVLGRTGSLLHGVFGVPHTNELDTLSAVRAALAIRDRFTGVAEVRAIVCTTEALVTFLPDAPAVVSPAIDASLRLIWTVPPGQVWACAATRSGSGAKIEYAPGGPPLWRVERIRPDEPVADWPLVERDHELAVLREHVDQVTRRGRGRLVTVVGETGTGKTRLIADLIRTIDVPVARVRVARHGSLALPEQPPAVLVVEDLHNADDGLLRQFGALAERTRTDPLLVIATARPDLFERGRFLAPASTTIVLDRLSDDAVRELWASMLGEDAAPTPELVDRIGGNPLFAVEFARHPPDQLAALPPTVYRAIAAELDHLPIADKQILRQATLVPDPIDPDSVAAVGQHDVVEAQRGLDALARRHLLRRNADSARYEFAQPLVREVAHAQLPKSERAVMPTGGGLSPVPPADRPPRAFRPA